MTMPYEENLDVYVEVPSSSACCCDTCNLHKKRHTVVISLLLAVTVATIVAGIYIGITEKEYSIVAIIAGILVPSILIVITCIYLIAACICDSFPPGISPEQYQPYRYDNVTQPPQTSLAVKKDSMKQQRDGNKESLNSSLRIKAQDLQTDGICGVAKYPSSYKETKVHGRHYRSISNPDIRKHCRKDNKILRRESEISKYSHERAEYQRYVSHQYVCGLGGSRQEMSDCSFRSEDDFRNDMKNQHPSYEGEYNQTNAYLQDKSYPVEFLYKNKEDSRYSETETEFYGYSDDSIHHFHRNKTGKHVDKRFRGSTKSENVPYHFEEPGKHQRSLGEYDYEYSNKTNVYLQDKSYPLEILYKNKEVLRDCEIETEFHGYSDESMQHLHRNKTRKTVDKRFRGSTKSENVAYPFEEARKHQRGSDSSGSILECTRPLDSLHLSPNRVEYFKDTRTAVHYSSNENEQISYSFNKNPKVPSNPYGYKERHCLISPQPETVTTDSARRKAVYVPPPSSEESVRMLPNYIQEHTRYPPNDRKILQKQASRNRGRSVGNFTKEDQTIKHLSRYNAKAQSVEILSKNSEHDPQKEKLVSTEYLLNRRDMAEQNMPGYLQREHSLKYLQPSEVSGSGNRENIANRLATSTQAQYMYPQSNRHMKNSEPTNFQPFQNSNTYS